MTKTLSELLTIAISSGAIIPPLYVRIVDSNKYELITGRLHERDDITATTSSY